MSAETDFMQKYATGQLQGAILRGEMDTVLDQLESFVAERKETIRKKAVADLKVGDTVRFTNHVSPMYLEGTEATVVGFATKRIKVKLDHTVGRFRAGNVIKCPAGIIEKVA